ncbi:hypothetical protein BHS09_02535 [Myxococcus xanthus]|uniref:Uncharacterized protein n=2 Tax=Myxococcus xanthus TaxID=34 RepID=A0AAE6KQD4_MYXXA|nr:hypothetical protein BHS09_02535 [Myxococcus xanthus]QDE73237.1 hypothetical protein BHS08_02535 [Myxococcus xanthus]QDF02077.1 hypothetical protein BHS04_02490 [Myxococcus xanthus]
MLVGMAVGMTVGTTTMQLLDPSHAGTVFDATLVGTVLLGALGYELTSHHSAKQFRSTRLTVAPTLLPGSRGTVGMGVALNCTWN